jgi:hypothetical protein
VLAGMRANMLPTVRRVLGGADLGSCRQYAAARP